MILMCRTHLLLVLSLVLGCTGHREITAPLCLALDHGTRQNVMPDFFVLLPGVDSGQLAVGGSLAKRPGPGSMWGSTVWWRGTQDSLFVSFGNKDQSTRYHFKDADSGFAGLAFGEIHIIFDPPDTAGFHSSDTTAVTAHPVSCDSLPLGMPQFKDEADTTTDAGAR